MDGKELALRIVSSDVRGAIEQLPASLQFLSVLERFHLHKPEFFHCIARDPSFTRYLPQNSEAFELPCFWVPKRHLYSYGEQECVDSFARSPHPDSVLFPLHPSAESGYADLLSLSGCTSAAQDVRVWAVPTASSRTLLAWPDQQPERAIFLKTSLFSPMLGDRRLRQKNVGRSIGVSRLFDLSGPAPPCGFQLLPECFGLVPRGSPDAGAMFRSLPPNLAGGDFFLVPLFALFGHVGGRTPLLLSMIQSGLIDVREFVEELLCNRFARLWLHLSMRHGLIIEAHAQNLLLVCSANLVPQACFMYRDLEGVAVDWQLRRALGLREPARLPCESKWYEAYVSAGFRYSEFAWYRWICSLQAYLQFFLSELQACLHNWQRRGLMPRIFYEDLVSKFSQCLSIALEEEFAVRVCTRSRFDTLKGLARELSLLRRALIRDAFRSVTPLP